eukprot:m.196573 g.196573  ORF g.196573 m.196573 type:complete len:324 (-) comp10088_c0_seq3:1626-2597(-)
MLRYSSRHWRLQIFTACHGVNLAGMLPKVAALVTPAYDAPLAAIDPEFPDALAAHVEVLPLAEAQAAVQRGERIDAILSVAHPAVTPAIIDSLGGSALKVISNYGVGCDHIDLAAATARGIPVGNTPGVLTDTTADMGFALLMAVARRIPECDTYARSPAYSKYDNFVLAGRDVHGATLGIVGMGRIGLEVARRGTGFKMRILYHNRSPRPEAAEVGAELVSLDRLLAESDYVVLVCPSSPSTRKLIDAAALAKMKKTASLINIARGDVVDTEALYQALAEGRIAGAGHCESCRGHQRRAAARDVYRLMVCYIQEKILDRIFQ